MCRASDFSREYDGACLQMRMSYSPAAHLFLFLVQWTDCHLAGALGLLRILIYRVEFSASQLQITLLYYFLSHGCGDPSISQCAAGVCGWNNHHVYA